MSMLLTDPSAIAAALRAAAPRPAETRVILGDPLHFDVEYVINPHMAGQVGNVNRPLARAQWEALRQTYQALGFEVLVVPAVQGLPDQVFVANPGLPVPEEGGWALVSSRMRNEARAAEPHHLGAFAQSHGARLVAWPDPNLAFEGMGDALWLVGRRALVMGYGFRTDLRAVELLAGLVGAPIVPIELVDERMYHLDTCLSVLDARSALWVPSAFTALARARIEATFEVLIEVPLVEALGALAANAHCPDGRHVLCESAAELTIDRVGSAGFVPLPLDTSEFRKSGGSVFCLKLMAP